MPKEVAMQYTIRHIHVWPVVKIAFFIFAISGFLVGLFWGMFLWIFSSVLGTIMPAEFEAPEMSGAIIVILAFVLTPMYGVFGAIGAGIGTAIYNVVGKLTGGIEIELVPQKSEPPVESEIEERGVDGEDG